MSKELEYFQEIIKVDEEALTLANKEKNKKRDVMLHKHWLNKRKNIIEQALKEHEQHKAIEEELGIDLISLINAIKNGFWSIKPQEAFFYPNNFYIDIATKCIHNRHLLGRDRFYFKDYGKTWALDKNELL